MEHSLTVLLPVHNAQSSLADIVIEALDVVSEFTERFDLLIVDDGSSDATSEVAHELSCRYPQVRAICHGKHLGREAAIRTGLERSSGQVVLLRDETEGTAIDAIGKLWHAAGREAVQLEEPTFSSGGKWTRITAGHGTARPGYRMIFRESMEELPSGSRPGRPNYLSRLKDFALGE